MKHKDNDIPVPMQYLKQFTDAFPGCFDKVEKIRAFNSQQDVPDWDDTKCYIPVNLTLGIMDDYREKRPNAHTFPAGLAALSSWRWNKTIYKFDKDFCTLLYEQKEDVVIPVEALAKTPYNCVYIDTEEADDERLGYFVWTDYDIIYKEYAMYFLELRESGEVEEFMVFLTPGKTISECMKNLTRKAVEAMNDKEIVKNGMMYGLDIKSNAKAVEQAAGEIAQRQTQVVAELLQPVLYLCAQNAEVEENPEQKKVYRKPSGAPKDVFRELRKWDVGVRIGGIIRKSKSAPSGESTEQKTGSHTSKRPHTRRGHYHHFWTGKKDGERELILKWVAPMFVGGNSKEEAPAVIHKVKNDEEK